MKNRMAIFIKTIAMSYIIPSTTRIGHVHLKVSNIQKALSFYRDILGFQVTQWYGDSAVFLSAGGYHHHIGLNTWYSKDGTPPGGRNTGLFHAAILFDTRKELAMALQQLLQAKYPLIGASDHGVSEAIYLDDPDGNGVELYCDRDPLDWPRDDNGNLVMTTEHLDLENLLQELNN
jgi:catechol 2,3-dioxygenase